MSHGGAHESHLSSSLASLGSVSQQARAEVLRRHRRERTRAKSSRGRKKKKELLTEKRSIGTSGGQGCELDPIDDGGL